MTYESTRKLYEDAGQGHLFQFWPSLSSSEQSALLAQLGSIDIKRVNRIHSKALEVEKATNEGSSLELIEPLPEGASSSTDDPAADSEWRKLGLRAVANGEVGVLLMAGGQGTRLGSSAPKGCYDIGLPSHKSLFQYQAERISRLQTVAETEFEKEEGSVIIPWYVMTSGPTRPETEKFFEDNSYFGLCASNVILFEQGLWHTIYPTRSADTKTTGTLPCLTMDGKVLLDTKSRVAVAPDGNGGLYAALRQPVSSEPENAARTVLSDLAARKIKYIHSYCVDNCLVKVADPIFIGYCIHKQSDCAAKVVPKSSPTESVGVVALRQNKYNVVEYSEITKVQAEQLDPKTGELAFRAGNIANHFYTLKFLNEVKDFEEELAYHIARKKIPHIDLSSGEVVRPTKSNGMKLEMFVFDVFPFTKRFAVLEVLRQEEFSPLKNAPGTGSDDPETSRKDLLSQHKRWLKVAGAKLEEGVEVEVSPLVSYAGEGLGSVKGRTIKKSGILNTLKDLDTLV